MRRAFTAAAVKLEDLAVATYNGQAVNLTPASLKAAARIVSVEARHAAWIRSIAGDVPATEATDPAIKEAETRAGLSRARLEGGMSRDGLPPRRSGHRRRAARGGRERRDLPGRLHRRHRRRRGGGVRDRPHRRGRGRQPGRRRAELRARARVPAVVVLHRGRALEGAAREGRRRRDPGGRGRAGPRRGVQGAAGPQGGQAAGLQLPWHDGGRAAVPQDGRRVRGPRGGGLQGPGAAACAPSRCWPRPSRSIPSRRATRHGCGSCSAFSRRSTRSTTPTPRRTSSAWWPGRTSSSRAPARRCAGTRVSADEPTHTRRRGAGRRGGVCGGGARRPAARRHGRSSRVAARGPAGVAAAGAERARAAGPRRRCARARSGRACGGA